MADQNPDSARRQKLAALLRARQAPAGQAIPHRCPGSVAPLSFAQARLWFLDQLVPDSPFYNVPFGIRIPGALDPATVQAALIAIAARHEALRTTIAMVDGQPVQQIHNDPQVPLETHDLTGLPPAEAAERVAALALEHGTRPFDLRHGPLVRAAVARLGPADSLFLLAMHHIVSDGWSLGVLAREFQVLYAAATGGPAVDLPPLPIQYADFAAWQRQRHARGGLAADLDYWTTQLADLPVLDLPTDYPRPAVQSFSGATLVRLLPRDLADRITALARSERTTVFTLLYAGFIALLHRYTGQDDIVIGEPVANRNRLELEPLIGFFVNSLVLRTSVAGNPSFRSLLDRARATILAADAHQDLPFELLVEALHPERTMGRNPLFQVSLQFFADAGATETSPTETSPTETSPTETGTFAPVEIEKGTASLDLAFDIHETADGFQMRIEFSTDLFRAATIEAMATHYAQLLGALVGDPERTITAVPLGEAKPVPAVGSPAANNAAPPLPHLRFMQQASATPDAVALDDGEARLTYAELDTRSDRIAAALVAAGAGAETIIGLHLGRSIGFVTAALGIWKAGAALLALDPALPPARLEAMLADAQPHLIIGDGDGPLASHAAHRMLATLEAADAPPVAAAAAAASDPHALAYAIYTSGSTGRPKAVLVEQGALARNIEWMARDYPLHPHDRALFKYAVTFDVAILEMLAPLVAGATLHILAAQGPVDPALLARRIAAAGVTLLDVVPAQLGLLLDQPGFPPRSLRRIICGGEALGRDLLDHVQARTGAEIVNMYGPTEATISAMAWRAGPDGSGPVPIGQPGTFYTAHILDRGLGPVPPGAIGELCIGGDALARGYLGLPELTRERFVPDPFRPGHRLYRTGDRARRLPSGDIEFLGRDDAQVKLRGHRIELGEVEAALASDPRVRACAAAIRHDAAGTPLLAAFIVPNDGAPEFWPSVGEYFAYDDLLYAAMTNDRVRMQAYRAVIDRCAAGKTVVDIGCGGDLALTRLCLDAGAAHVHAIEMDPVAAASARRLAESLGLADRITIIEGDSRSIMLPAPVDVCVSELIGTMGSSEGVIAILNDARRFLKPGGIMIPQRCTTHIAAVSLPDALRDEPGLQDLPRHYATRIFEKVGHKFDLRLCARNLPATAVVSDPAVFESLDFAAHQPEEDSRAASLTISGDGRIDGFILSIVLETGAGERIDALAADCTWLPLFLPAFTPPLAVARGDKVALRCARMVDEPGAPPDYLVRGTVIRQNGDAVDFLHESPRIAPTFGATPFHARVFAPSAGAGDVADAGIVESWREEYEAIYAQADRETVFDTIGWNSSYDGAPLSDLDMREQVEGTLARIEALGARRILEIGCGTGLLMLPLAPHVDRYVGTDFSPAVLAALAPKLHGIACAELHCRDAADVSGLPQDFDLVVLNSTVQYFPNMDYLARVLSGAASVLRPGGYIFIGDVRSLPLVNGLYADLEHSLSGGTAEGGTLQQAILARQRRERELLVDPAFFPAFAAATPGFGSGVTQLKRGRRTNELSAFRYDALFRIGPPTPALDVRRQPWSSFGTLAALEAALAAEPDAPLLVTDIPCARLAPAAGVLERLHGRPDAGSPEPVHPEDLWALTEHLPWQIQLESAASGRFGLIDALLCPASSGGWQAALPPPTPLPWPAYANSRNQGRRDAAATLAAVRRSMETRLPAHLVPSRFVAMQALSLTAHGKLDRAALPDIALPAEDGRVVAPETPLEELLHGVWREVLARDSLGVEANFFAIGGHSLLAMQVTARLAARLGHDVPLRLMFEHPTIRRLASAIEAISTIEPAAAVRRAASG